MKRFISIVCTYILAVLLIVLPPEIYKMGNRSDICGINGGEVRIAVRKSKTKARQKVRTLILGDSSGHSLYPPEKNYDGVVSLTCNQAVTMAGHYFLLKNYLETNRDNLPEEIILLFTPGTFDNNVDIFAYQYFLKPFPVWEYRSLYTEYLYSRIKSIPWYWTANLPFIQTSNYAPAVCVPAEMDREDMSKLSAEYLLKIDSIAGVYGVPYSLRSTPVRDDRIAQLEIACPILLDACPSNMKKAMEAYIQSIEFLPSELFTDYVHLKRENIPEDYLGVLEAEDSIK